MIRLGSLCTGYGGLDLGTGLALGPLEHVWHAEIDPDASKVLAAHWPDVPNLGDLTAVDWARVEPVDVLTAGFPCQDVSAAGKRAGLVGNRWELPDDVGEMSCGCFPMNHKVWCEDVSPLGWSPANGGTEERSMAAAEALNDRDKAAHPEWLVEGTRTGVWSYIAYAIGILRPQLVVLENVEGLLSARTDSDVEPCPWCLGDTPTDLVVRALGAVLADLAGLGFDAEWITVPASAVGAPHRRKRVFIVAWPAADPPRIGHGDTGTAGRAGRAAAVAGGAGTGGLGLLPTPRARDHKGRDPNPRGVDLNEAVALLPTPNAALGRGTGAPSPTLAANRYAQGKRFLDDAVALLPTPRATDGTKGGPNQRGSSGDLMLPSAVMLLPTPTAVHWARNATADRKVVKDTTNDAGWTLGDVAHAERWGDYAPAIARWERALGRPAPEPTEPGTKGQPRLAPAFVEWLMGLPAGWVTDHLPRNPALRVLGNGVVPQQAAAAIRELVSA